MYFSQKFCIEISNLDGDADSNPKSTFHWFSQNREVYGRFYFDRMSILGTLTHIATAFCFYMHTAESYKSFFANSVFLENLFEIQLYISFTSSEYKPFNGHVNAGICRKRDYSSITYSSIT